MQYRDLSSPNSQFANQKSCRLSCHPAMITDLILLRYQGRLAEVGYGKYLVVPFLVRFDGILVSFDLDLAKLRTAI